MKRIGSCLVLLFVFLGTSGLFAAVNAQSTVVTKMSMEKELAIEEKLKQLNKPAVKTIHGEDGDIIDCLDIYKQPAFDNPLLKDHKIQMRPSDEVFAKLAEISSTETPDALPAQLWRQNESCPQGTVPILRVQKWHLLHTSSLETYGRKPWHGPVKKELHSFNRSYPVEFNQLHEESVLIGAGYSYLGATAEISVWNPRVAAKDEYSSGQFWLRNGPYSKSNSIEVGWIVYPELYGDYTTRFFVYWTNDSSISTGCFNVACPGFVQTSTNTLLGAKISPISKVQGGQYSITPTIIMDLKTYDKWWVLYGGKPIGYWPIEILGSLGKVAALALFGGDVYSPQMKNQPPHTTTQMGSGQYAAYHWRGAAFIRKPRVMGYNKVFDYPDPGQTLSMHVDCYSGENFAEKRFTEPLFYFGGPGRNNFCP